MKRILIARSAGFCFGVKRAISIANETAGGGGNTPSADSPIYSLGPLIHNPQAVEELEGRGVHVVQSVDQIPCGQVIVRSHGITRPDHEALVAKGVRIVDATCPFVNKAQEHARSLSREGYAVVVVGDANHPEVKSIISYIEPGVPILTSLADIREGAGIRKAGVVAQTTQSFDNLMEFVSAALKKFPEVRVYNTICHATILRQKESTAVAGKADVMIVLGGYNSANTRRLAEICREINPRTHHIETADELPGDRLAGAECVGVTAGASTPQWIIDGLVAKIREMWRDEAVDVAYYK
ncbi:MAG TPA: 4-hydroxy-3-methylbut-2-enyl diphosphate reductase [Candidatus Deferrimicrobiaceae bacterium]|nr:4-hydroxy-3-methylbut-2-enyl diphosphate reductase [Candidatus Deferrimicrobiaceae bacterium]